MMSSKQTSFYRWLGLTAILLTFAACAGEPNRQPSPADLVYSVPEMHCDGCVKSISTALADLPGVDSVHVSLNDYTAFLRVDTVKVSTKTIVSTIEGLGYTATTKP